ncbi:glycosyltransferase [Paenibacillus sp. sgz500958]|uniref:glycosyltransferase n=1 Tax=Paenibacillus sp. sgz500958 TaxID=3242475 RepID=UPI0036D2113B
MKRRIVVDIRFNNMGFQKERLTKPWIQHRIGLFKELTLKSLLLQSNQNFLTLLKYDPKSHDALFEVLEETGLHLPDNIRFVPVGEIDSVVSSYIEGYDELYITRTDSDDLLHKEYIQLLHDYRHLPDTEALINQNGYYWDWNRNEMAPAKYSSPQFYVLIYKADNYRKGERYTVRDHSFVIKFANEKLPGRNWVNVVHSTNSSPKKVPGDHRMTPDEIDKVLVNYLGRFQKH